MGKEYTRSLTTLGSVPFSGQIILAEDFANLHQWSKVGGIGDAIFELDPSVSLTGQHSLHMKTRVSGAANYDEIAATHFSYLLPSKLLRFFTTFRIPDKTKVKSFDLTYQWYDDTDLHSAILQFFPQVPEWLFTDSAATPTLIPGSGVDLAQEAWHQVNLQLNFNSDRYVSLAIDHLLFDLSSNALRVVTDGNPSRILHTLNLISDTTGPAEIYLNNVLISEL